MSIYKVRTMERTMNLEKRLEIKNASKRRVQAMQFGDPVTNVCAGSSSPLRHVYFVEYIVDTYVNRYGIEHSNYIAKCTDKKGKFLNIDIEVIYPGHLDNARCEELFKPIWEMHYAT